MSYTGYASIASPLFFAAEAGHEAVVTLLLEHGAHSDEKDLLVRRAKGRRSE
jgi:ankyrin repeat protein